MLLINQWEENYGHGQEPPYPHTNPEPEPLSPIREENAYQIPPIREEDEGQESKQLPQAQDAMSIDLEPMAKSLDFLSIDCKSIRLDSL